MLIDLDLHTFQQLCSIENAYQVKMCVHFLELFFLKCKEIVAFLFKINHVKEKCPFLFKK